MCDHEHYQELTDRVNELEDRLCKVESEVRSGFVAVNSNIETLSQQLTNMDKRIIEEKQRWGEVFRGIVKWTVRALLAIAVYAAGVNLSEGIITKIFN